MSLVSAIKSIPNFYSSRSHKNISQTFKIIAASRKDDPTLITKKGSKRPRRLITISTGDGRWQGKWTNDYILSLSDLRLEDLIEDEQKDAMVSINLSIQKARKPIIQGIIRNSNSLNKLLGCINQFETAMQALGSRLMEGLRHPSPENAVTALHLTAERRAKHETHLPEIGDDDPSVIYVKPGHDADLDSMVQDTIRLTASVKDTCSELCEKSEPTLQYIVRQSKASAAKRWSRLLELKNAKKK